MKNALVLNKKSIEYILGYPVTNMSIKECILQMSDWIENGQRNRWFVCVNPHTIEIALIDQFFDIAIRDADLSVPDGIGVVMASKLFDGHLKQRITGPDLFIELSEALNKKNKYSYFFLGSKHSTLALIEDRMKEKFPNIRIVGTYAPPFKSDFDDRDNKLMIEIINSVKPDVLWVGMTAPKQEKWIYANRKYLNVKFIGPIGAAFDIFAGTVKDAPGWIKNTGFQWLYRFAIEPRRLFRRNMISMPKFVYHTLLNKFKG